jgi:hypothetical protein
MFLKENLNKKIDAVHINLNNYCGKTDHLSICIITHLKNVSIKKIKGEAIL